MMEEDVVKNRKAMHLLQRLNAFKFNFEGVFRCATGKPFPEVEPDRRKTRLPTWVKHCKQLLRWFEVNDKLEFRKPQRFTKDGMLKVTWAEIARLSRGNDVLTNEAVDDMLTKLSATGVITRFSPYNPQTGKRSLHIRFNAGRLIWLIRNCQSMRFKADMDVLEIEEDGTVLFSETHSVDNTEYTSLTYTSSPRLPVSSPSNLSGIRDLVPLTTEDVQEQRELMDAPPGASVVFPIVPENQESSQTTTPDEGAVPAQPSAETSEEKVKTKPMFAPKGTKEALKIIRNYYAGQKFTELDVKRIIYKMSNSTREDERMTIDRLVFWYFASGDALYEEWCHPELASDLIKNWGRIWRHIYCSKTEATLSPMILENHEEETHECVHMLVTDLAQSFTNYGHSPEIPAAAKLAKLEDVSFYPPDRIHSYRQVPLAELVARFVVAKGERDLHPLWLSPAMRACLRRELMNQPTVYQYLKKYYTELDEWAGIKLLDRMKIAKDACEIRLRVGLQKARLELVTWTTADNLDYAEVSHA